jgi:hypothetical protein
MHVFVHFETTDYGPTELRGTPELVVDDSLTNDLSQSTRCLAHELGDLVMIGGNTLVGLSTSNGRALNGTFRRSLENGIGRPLKTSAERTLPFSEQVIVSNQEASWVIVWIAPATGRRDEIGKDIETKGV